MAAPLAILGGPPAFPEPLLIGRPTLPRPGLALRHIRQAIACGQLSNSGPLVRRLEDELAEFLEVPHLILVANGTLGLQLVLAALDLRGEVILPSFTYVATPHAVAWQGLTPVFCDIDPRTHTIDPAAAAAVLTSRTCAILGVHLWGRPAPVAALESLARERGVRLLFDAAHALGARVEGRRIGAFGDAEVFSLHATKTLSTIEGGAICTRDPALARRLRAMRRCGIDESGEVVSLGTNATMSEVAAAFGLAGIGDLGRSIERSRRVYEAYEGNLRALPGLALVPMSEREGHSFQFCVLEIAPDAPLGRHQLSAALLAEGIVTRPYFSPPCHSLRPYADTPLRAPLPHTERVSDAVLCLPAGGAVTPRQAARIARIIGTAWEHAGAVRERLAQRQGAEGEVE